MTTETLTTQIQIMKEDLLESLKIVSGVIESSQVIQILSFVRIIGEGNQLKLMTSNSEVQLEAFARVAGELGEPVDFAVPCKKLLNIARNISNDVLLTLIYDDQWLTVKTESSTFQLATLPSSQFPEFSSFSSEFEHALPEESLKMLIEKTCFSMAQQDVRFFLNGLLLQISEQGLEAVATDGHRMAFGCLSDIKGGAIRAIVPRKTVFELLRLLSESEQKVSLAINSNSIRIQTSQFTLLSNLIDGNYPNCHQLIPKQNNLIAKISVASLQKALSRVSILANEKFKGAKLTFMDHSLQIVSSNVEHEKAEEQLKIHYDGPSLTIGFNIVYLQEVLSIVSSEEVSFALPSSDQSVLICDENLEDFQYVVAPLTL